MPYERPQERFAFLCLGQAQIMLEQRSESGDDWVADVLERPFGRGLNFQLQVPDLDALLLRCEQPLGVVGAMPAPPGC